VTKGPASSSPAQAGGVTKGAATTDGSASGGADAATEDGPVSGGAVGDPAVDAWRGLLVAHSKLVPVVEADLRAAGQVPLSWYDVLLELDSAPDRRLRMSELGQRTVLSRTRVSRVVDELAAGGLAERQPDQADGRSRAARPGDRHRRPRSARHHQPVAVSPLRRPA
jgi:hypothetical protein